MLVLEREDREAISHRVRAAVAALPPRLREVIVLRYAPDTELSAAEIAEALSLHKSTVHRRLNGAERVLARSLADLSGVTARSEPVERPEGARGVEGV